MKELNARTVTQDAGCALGSLYTVFHDLDDLIIHMNSRTLHLLGDAVAEASEKEIDPVSKLKALARAYVDFATRHHALWIALFDYAALTGTKIPQWHQEEQALLIDNIVQPVSTLSEDLDEEALGLRIRTLFSAVHGIVSISLEDRFIGLPRENLDAELMRFIDQMVAGLKGE
jgi:AcrR family transcriptional regulator